MREQRHPKGLLSGSDLAQLGQGTPRPPRLALGTHGGWGGVPKGVPALQQRPRGWGGELSRERVGRKRLLSGGSEPRRGGRGKFAAF